ncbi:transcription activator acu-15 [Fusarium beomiforme]|uniref:Transcription activator acu-15 n=1 Tax=Fusarium beomiforme TaxID=44412 RepID=A0A9P5ANI5_9HYPO|nr:transcription activator acu-15 [Fusarium beomiforme]
MSRPPDSSLVTRGGTRVQNELRQMQTLLQSLLSQPNHNQAAINCDALAEGVDRIRQAIDGNTSSEFTAPQVDQLPDNIFGYLDKVTSKDILAALPSRPDTDEIVSAYLKASHIAVPFIHKHQFRRQYEAFWQEPVSANLLWVSILFSVLATGLAIAGKNRASASSSSDSTTFISMSARCIVSGKYRMAAESSVEALAMHLHARCFYRSDQDIDLSQLHALAVRIAQQRFYHVDGGHFSQIVTPFQAEMRRRVWYYLQYYDVLLSLEHGLPPLIHEDTYSVGHPTNVRDDEFDETSEAILPSLALEAYASLPCVFISRLLPILRSIIYHALGLKTCTYQDAMSLKANLKEWYTSIPGCLSVRPIKRTCFTDSSFTIMQRILLQLIYNTGITLIYRPFLSITSPENRYCGSALDICRKNALRSIEIYVDVDQEMQKGGRLHDDQQITANLPVNDFFMMMIVAPLELFGCPNPPADQKDHIINTLQRATQLWPTRSCVSSYALESSRLLRLTLADIYMASSIPRSIDSALPEFRQDELPCQQLSGHEVENEGCKPDDVGDFQWQDASALDWVSQEIVDDECLTNIFKVSMNYQSDHVLIAQPTFNESFLDI